MEKKILLTPMKSITGQPFRKVVEDSNGNPVLELRKDSQGNPVLQVPRDEEGKPRPNVMPEPVYIAKTEVLDEHEALIAQLKRLYLNIPREKFTRNDTILGSAMIQDMEASKDGVLVLGEGVYKWLKGMLSTVWTVKEKRKGEKDGEVIEVEHGIGLDIFGVNLSIIEDAFDNVEKPIESKKKEP